MTNNKHTPGPWSIFESRDDAWQIVAVREEHPDNWICTVDYTGGNAEANAHLIAATPRMFEMLQEALTDLNSLDYHNKDWTAKRRSGYIQHIMKDIKLAISNAEGEGGSK